MSEQKWTQEDQWELIDDEHVCTLRIGEAYAGIPYQPPHGRGRCERQRADGRRLIQCVKACKGIPDPAAEIARLREVEAELTKLRTVYAAAVEECKHWRQLVGEYDQPNEKKWWHHDGKGWFHIDSADAHDAARAEAGMENL